MVTGVGEVNCRGGGGGFVDGGAGVEDGEVVRVGFAEGGGIFGVGGVDDGGVEAAGAFHVDGVGGVEVEIQHCKREREAVREVWRESASGGGGYWLVTI